MGASVSSVLQMECFAMFQKKEINLLFFGLDNSGKTTLLRRLKTGRVESSAPTYHPNREELEFGNCKFRIIDLGGHESVRKTWLNVIADCNTDDLRVVFVVDTWDRERFPEAKRELENLLKNNNELKNCPFLILGNKTDMGNCASEGEFRSAFNLEDTTGKDAGYVRPGSRAIEVFMCSIVRGNGYKDGLQWLCRF